jgi:hypothetical protein
MEKLKRVVIKEELVALTGDFRAAIVLNQFLYWSDRIKDIDKYIKEENNRIKSHGITESGFQLNHGWIYKSSNELIDECMFVTRKKVRGKDLFQKTNIKEATMNETINYLVENGWLQKRQNPEYKWDRKYQYRVDFIKISKDLLELGFVLQGYNVFDVINKEFSSIQSSGSNASSKIEDGNSIFEDQSNKNRRAIPEITTEITTDNINNNNDKKMSIENSKEKNIVVVEKNKLITEIITQAKTMDIPVNIKLAELLINAGNKNMEKIINALKAAAQWKKTKVRKWETIDNWTGVLLDAVKNCWQPGPDLIPNSKRNTDYSKLYEI